MQRPGTAAAQAMRSFALWPSVAILLLYHHFTHGMAAKFKFKEEANNVFTKPHTAVCRVP